MLRLSGLLIAVCASACASQPPARPAVASTTATPAPPPQPAASAQLTSAAPSRTRANRVEGGADAAPPICEIGSEAEVADVILSRSGNGLLWLIVPDPNEPNDPGGLGERGLEEVRDARALAECLLRHHDAGFDPTQSQGFEAFETWVDVHVGDEHPHTLLAAGAAYLASMLAAESAIDAMFDLPVARLFLERATATAPELADGLGPLILGSYQCFVPQPLGGKPELGLNLLRGAAEHSETLKLAMKVAAAELCAVAMQDRGLFDSLLDEVDASQGSSSTFDLLAKHRAETLRADGDEMFLE